MPASAQKAGQALIPIHESAFPTPGEAKDIERWIPIQCCRSARCCFKINAADLTPISKDKWIVNATQQVRDRTDWSQDGKVWRCACDMIDGKWTVHLMANTRCVFPAINAAGLR